MRTQAHRAQTRRLMERQATQATRRLAGQTSPERIFGFAVHQSVKVLPLPMARIP